jgi:hypothetical protein
MCFNGAKSWQLGWYSEYHVDLSTNDYDWSGDLVGFAEKDNINKMIIRIQDATKNIDTYVHFNRQIGFNSETQEGGNQVLVSTRSGDAGYATSSLETKLDANGVYTINDIGGSGASVTITVNSIDTSTTPAKANISVQLVPQATSAPAVAPTAAPVVSPTAAPVVPPTDAPVVSPTDAPVVAPTASPVVSPTDAPVVSPTDAPVVSPTDTPVVAPTDAPVAPPSDYRNCDDTEEKFKIDNRWRTCDWLRFLPQRRIDNICEPNIDGVKTKCIETCGGCDDQCYDDVDAVFDINKNKQRGCRWIAAKNNRTEKYCKVGHDAFYICKETCENCDGNNDIRPTAPPLDECTDDASFRFQYKNQKKKRSCKWLSRKNQGKQEKICGRSGVADKCPESCDATC